MGAAQFVCAFNAELKKKSEEQRKQLVEAREKRRDERDAERKAEAQAAFQATLDAATAEDTGD